MKEMKVTVQMIADYKDWMDNWGEINMPVPTVESAEDLANYILFQFSDDEIAMDQLYNIITHGEKYYMDMDAEEVINILIAFFTHLPKRLRELTVTYLHAKNMQYQEVMKEQTKIVMDSMLEKIQTLIGQSTENLPNEELIPID